MKPKNKTSLLRGFGWKIFHSAHPGGITDACQSAKVTGMMSSVHCHARIRAAEMHYKAKNIRTMLAWGMLMVLCSAVGTAQNFNNNGQIKNSGVIRIKNAMNGIPSSLNGTFELFGTNQILPATQYHHVLLSGSGTKTTSPGNFSISGNLTIAAPVIFDITKGNIITLGDTLFESGTLAGAIQKSVDLTGSTTSSNFGNIGAAIGWSSTAPGITNVLRISDSVLTGNGNQSIKRIYTITPTATDATGTVTLKYASAELNGNSAGQLELWKTLDNGATWLYQGGTVDTVSMQLTKTNAVLAGMWTASDSLHRLGSIAQANVPIAMSFVSPNTASDTITSQLNSFTLLVVDAFGSPVKNVPVSFSLGQVPGSAVGQLLSDTLVNTDSTGKASTRLTLGNKVGTYIVNASSGTLSPISFTATALHGAPSVISYVEGNNQLKQILETVDTSFTVTLHDAGGNPVNNALVLFSISGRPVGASGDSLSADSVMTDSVGRASTVLTLGNKVGMYTVSAVSASLTPVLFTASAVHGPASSLARTLGNAQSKSISTTLDTAFVVTVNDAGGNPVADATVQFSISSIPSGAAGQSLTAASALTDSLGQASTVLTLGNRTGTYKVSATVSGSAASPIEFNATALPGLPAILNIAAGSNQSAVNGQPLADPFVVLVVDGGGNPVAGASIQFGITSAPTGASGQGLSDTLVATDNSGQASTRLTLGNKTGEYTVVAHSPSVGGTLIFRAKAIAGAPASMTALAGNNQSAAINTVLPVGLSVQVHDSNGNPVPNDSVTFTISAQPVGAVGAQLNRTASVTDSNGAASTQITLGNKVGTYSVTATVNGIPTVVFTSTAHPGIAVTMAALAGNNQSAAIITALGSELIVNVKDAGGNNTPNVPVTFAVVAVPENAAMYSLSDTIVQTDAGGIARTSFRIGSKVGTYIVRASGAGIPNVDFSATALPGAPAALQAVAGSSQTKQILTSLDIPFTVRITDIGGNNVPSSAVRFAVTSSPAGAFGAVVSDSISLSDSAGTAQARLTLGSKTGLYEVTAFVQAGPVPESRSIKNPKGKFAVKAADVIPNEIKFTATAVHGAAAAFAQTSGDQQLKPTETKLDTAFAVTIHDIGGNIVPDAPVRFAISSAPVNASGQQLSDTLVTADSTGTASTYLTLGDHEGVYTVSAAVPAVAPKLFIANAYFIYGDPNSDIDINVADITTIIDHAVTGKLLSYADSVKADLNHDGKVDTADVNVLRDIILNTPLVFAEPVIPDESAAPEKAVKAAVPLMKQTYFNGASTELAITPQGLRVNLNNSVPVRGIELRLRLKDTTAVDKINYLFSRAQGMTTAVKSSNRDITLLAYSLTNAEIASGNGSILRLPNITSLDQIDTSEVILSISSNIAVQSAVTTASASPSEYPTTFELDQNYPNPFNGSTIIQYSIPDVRTTETKIAIHIFNILGQKVKTLVTGPHDPGKFKITWDGTNDDGARVSSGVYFYRLIAKNFLTTKKMIYVK